MKYIFQKASTAQKEAKARLALVGPSGSGKTYSALEIAQGMGQKIAVIDTEHGSSARYADRFDFYVLKLDEFSPRTYIQAIKAAEEAEFDVLIIDSLSHAWMGRGGALDMVHKAEKRYHGNSFAAWQDVTPHHKALIDALIRCKCHLIATMRSKTKYVVEENDQGRMVPRQIGLEPVQRGDVGYEFDVIGDLDTNHNMSISKTRCSAFDGVVISKPTAAFGAHMLAWLHGKPIPLQDLKPNLVTEETVAAKAPEFQPAVIEEISETTSKAPEEEVVSGVSAEEIVETTSAEETVEAAETLAETTPEQHAEEADAKEPVPSSDDSPEASTEVAEASTEVAEAAEEEVVEAAEEVVEAAEEVAEAAEEVVEVEAVEAAPQNESETAETIQEEESAEVDEVAAEAVATAPEEEEIEAAETTSEEEEIEATNEESEVSEITDPSLEEVVEVSSEHENTLEVSSEHTEEAPITEEISARKEAPESEEVSVNKEISVNEEAAKASSLETQHEEETAATIATPPTEEAIEVLPEETSVEAIAPETEPAPLPKKTRVLPNGPDRDWLTAAKHLKKTAQRHFQDKDKVTVVLEAFKRIKGAKTSKDIHSTELFEMANELDVLAQKGQDAMMAQFNDWQSMLSQDGHINV